MVMFVYTVLLQWLVSSPYKDFEQGNVLGIAYLLF